LVAVRLTWMSPEPRSTSDTLSWLELPAENTSAVSSLVDCGPGTLLTGASLTALTVTVSVATAEVTVPSLTVNSTMRLAVSGSWSVLLYLTAWRHASYWALVAEPDRARTPVVLL